MDNFDTHKSQYFGMQENEVDHKFKLRLLGKSANHASFFSVGGMNYNNRFDSSPSLVVNS